MNLSTFSKGRRQAEIGIASLPGRLVLWLYDKEWGPNTRTYWITVVAQAVVPDNPANRAHLRTLAIDWCAHGIGWCDARARGGLPKRGAMSLEAVDRAVWRASDRDADFNEARRLDRMLGRMEREREAVREVSR